MMSPFCWVTGGGDQEKFTCLCPVTASNPSGVPDGAVYNYMGLRDHLVKILNDLCSVGYMTEL